MNQDFIAVYGIDDKPYLELTFDHEKNELRVRRVSDNRHIYHIKPMPKHLLDDGVKEAQVRDEIEKLLLLIAPSSVGTIRKI